MSASKPDWKTTASRESALFLILMFVGLFLLPVSIYFVGHAMFGAYGGSGFSAFYGALHSDLRAGVGAVWFLVCSPYLGWQLLRLTWAGFRLAGKPFQ